MERCPKCGKILLAETGMGYKKCYNDDCTCRVYSDGSYSFLRHDQDKIRRVRKYFDGKEETINSFLYP